MDFFSIIIDRVNSTNVFNIVQGRLPSRDTHLQTRVDDDLILEFLQETERLSHISNSMQAGQGGDAAGAVEVSRELRRIGETFFLQFFPEQIQDRLRSAQNAFLFLHVDHRLRNIPWEVLHTGRCFLADAFYLGKNIDGYWRETSRTERDRLRMLIIADPTEDLEWARQEGEGLFESLTAEVSPDRLDVQFMSGRRISKLNLLNAIKDRDIIHYAGHMHYSRDQQESGWLLADGKVLRAREIEKAGVVPDLVFANSCLSFATDPELDEEIEHSGTTGGVFNDLAGAFLRAGICNYLGTNWEIADSRRTFEFALQFYRTIFEERSVGEALFEARRHARRVYEPYDLTWARYALHGNPMARIYRSGNRRSFDASRNVLHARSVVESYPQPIAEAYSALQNLSDKEELDITLRMDALWRLFEVTMQLTGALIFGNCRYLNIKAEFPDPDIPLKFREYVDAVYKATARLRSLHMELSPGRMVESLYLHRDTIEKFLDARDEYDRTELDEDIAGSYFVTYHYFIDNLLFDLAPLGRYQLLYLEHRGFGALMLNGMNPRPIHLLPAEFEDEELKNLMEENRGEVCFYNSSRRILIPLTDFMSYETETGCVLYPRLRDSLAGRRNATSGPAAT